MPALHPVINGKKKCTRCGHVKRVRRFLKLKSRRGDRSACRLCTKNWNKDYNRKHRERNRRNDRIWYLGNPVKVLFILARTRSRDRGLTFDLDLLYLQELWCLNQGRCSITGLPFDLSESNTP